MTVIEISHVVNAVCHVVLGEEVKKRNSDISI